MAKRETRPADYPKLEDYEPTRFMLPTSHYDEKKADKAIRFIEMLRHTKGKWAGSRFWLLPWQTQIIKDLFGIVDKNGKNFILFCRLLKLSYKKGKNRKLLL